MFCNILKTRRSPLPYQALFPTCSKLLQNVNQPVQSGQSVCQHELFVAVIMQ
jgi:hypothetical protein